MRKIAFFVSNLSSGGAERVCVNLANFISKKDEVAVYLISHFGGGYDSLVNHEVHRIETSNKSLFSLVKEIKNTQFDVIMSTLPSCNVRLVMMKPFLNSKTLYLTRACNVLYPWYRKESAAIWKGHLVSYLDHRSYLLSDYAIANSPDTAASMRRICMIPENRIFTIGNPVTPPKKEIKAISQTKFPFKYILAVGNLRPQKRYDLMLDAFKIIANETDLHLCVLGEGMERKMIEEKIRNLKLEERVHLLGSQKEIGSYYENAECFIHSAQFDGFGNVFVEALSYGAVPICFNCQGGPNYILDKGKYGVLVPFGNVEELAEGVINVVNGKRVFNKEELRKRAEFFSIQEKGEEYYNLFKTLYEKKNRETF